MKRTLVRLTPWLLSGLIVAWLFASVDLDAVRAAFERADLVAFATRLVGFTIFVFFADSSTLYLLFRRVITRGDGDLRARDVLAVRGTSYFFGVLNYSAGSAAIALFVHRRKQIPFLETLSALLWLNFVDIIALVILLTIGLIFGRDLVPEAIAARLPYVVAGGWAIVLGALAYWRLGINWFVLGRMRTWRIFTAFARATWSDYAALIGARTAFVSLYVAMNMAILPTFHIEISLGALLVYTPLLTFVQIVPASISGLGAITAVMVALYAPHVDPAYAAPSEAAAYILAMATASGPATSLIRMGIGYLFVANVSRDFLPSAEAINAARAAESEAKPDAL